MIRWVAAVAFVGLVATACAAERGVQPQAVSVRLDVIARALARIEERNEASRSEEEPAFDARRSLSRALEDAQESLFIAQRAEVSWEKGDARGWTRVRPCLAMNLERVDRILETIGWLPPPGLTEVVTRAPLEVCAESSRRGGSSRPPANGEMPRTP